MQIKASWLIGLLGGLSLFASVPPEHWPLHASTVKSITVDSGIEIKAGARFTLLRIEEGKVLATFGRKGTYWVDLEKTDVALLSNQIACGDLRKIGPNLVERLYNTLYLRNEKGGNRPVRFEDVSDKDYLLFYFAYGSAEKHRELITELSQEYDSMLEKVPALELIMIQCDALVFNNIDSESVSWPFMGVNPSHAYKDAMHLGQIPGVPCFLLTGSNGNVIKRFEPDVTPLEVLTALSQLDLD